MTRIRTHNRRAKRANACGVDPRHPVRDLRLNPLMVIQVSAHIANPFGDEFAALIMEKAPIYYNDDGLRIITEAAMKLANDPRYKAEIEELGRQSYQFVIDLLGDGDAP